MTTVTSDGGKHILSEAAYNSRREYKQKTHVEKTTWVSKDLNRVDLKSICS
ncbi:MAG: hypothetical protein JNL58_06695 [Planctomyces sp.]|nr:hypothetical protein [Planctomyces sp.]